MKQHVMELYAGSVKLIIKKFSGIFLVKKTQNFVHVLMMSFSTLNASIQYIWEIFCPEKI